MTSLPAPNQDPDFNINTAMNTFNQRLGELVRSGQMTVAQAQAAQGDMRALQLNPAAANRQAATDIAQRHLQVGKYAPAQQPQGGLTVAEQPEIVVTPQRPMPQGVSYGAGVGPSSPMPVMPTPTDMREVIGSRMPPPGVRSGDTRIFADQPTQQNPMISDMRYRGPQPTEHQMLMQQISNRLRNFQPGVRGMQPNVIDNRIGPNFGKPMQPEGLGGIAGMLSKFGDQLRNAESMPKSYVSAPRQLSPEEAMGITSMSTMPQGVRYGAGVGGGMPMQTAPQGLTLSNVPQQGADPQPMTAPQGMAMGGLMAKYYGGAC